MTHIHSYMCHLATRLPLSLSCFTNRCTLTYVETLKKSTHVSLGLLAALAVSLTSCNRREMQRCVDELGKVAVDQYCEQGYTGYHWYYGGLGGYVPGTFASGGSFSPHSGFTGVTSSGASVSRGGFGSSASHGGSSGE